MTKPQLSLYWREWAKVKKVLRETMSPADAEAERHKLHVKALGEGNDKSALTLNNDDFDLVLAEFRAISQPGNATTQIDLAGMKATRKRTYIRQILAALGETDVYAESIILSMYRKKPRNQRSTGAASMLTLDTLHVGDLDKVKIALKKETRRRWPTKDHLLGEIYLLLESGDFNPQAATAAVAAALSVQKLPPLEKLYFEPLLIVLGTLKTLASDKVRLPPISKMSHMPA